jgi:hypothetical protein
MDRKLRFGVVMILALASFSCARTIVPQPGKITLEAAMKSVVEGLRQLRDAEGGLRTGLIADEVTVAFNVSASGTDSSSLHLEMTPIPTSPMAGGKASTDFSSSFTASRGNQITIKFKNIMTAPTNNTLITNTDNLDKVLEIMKKAGSQPQGPIFYTVK